MTMAKKGVLAALAAMLLLAVIASAASALRSLSVTSRTLVLLAPELTFFEPTFRLEIVCRVGITVTLENNPIPKTARLNIGRVAFAVLEPNCSAATRVRIIGGPFTMNYLSFTGVLPAITGLNLQILRFVFLIESAEFRCQTTTNMLGLQNVEAGGVIKEYLGTGAERQFTLETEILRSLGACPFSLGIKGRLNTMRNVTLTLI